MLDCKLNKNWKAALQAAKKHIKKETKIRTVYRDWGGNRVPYTTTTENWKYKNKDITGPGERLNPWPRRLSCCGIDEAVWTNLHTLTTLRKFSQEEFNIIVAWYLDQCRTRRDKRVVITGLPMEVKSSSLYKVAFYKRLRKALLHFGFVELTKSPYTNMNSKNKITVLVGKYV